VTTADPTPEGPVATPNAGFRLVLLGILVVALLAAAGTLVWLLAERRGTASDVQSERDAVQRQTEQFVLRLNTYGPQGLDAEKHLPTYQKQVAAVITAKFATDFEKSGLPIAEQTVAQAGYADPDHPKDETKRVESEPAVLRWEVKLVHTDDGWRVDDYSPVKSEAGQ
jgi:Mce-associated membrane protein